MQAVTKDNVTISIDGVLYVKVVDPVQASYGVGVHSLLCLCVHCAGAGAWA